MGAVTAQRVQHEQQAHQLVLRAVLVVTMQGGQHEDIAAARVFQGPPLVFTVMKRPVLHRRQGLTQALGHTLRQRRSAVQREKHHRAANSCTSSLKRGQGMAGQISVCAWPALRTSTDTRVASSRSGASITST